MWVEGLPLRSMGHFENGSSEVDPEANLIDASLMTTALCQEQKSSLFSI
jgi:hypothetical protein